MNAPLFFSVWLFSGSNFLFCTGIPADGIIPFQMETASGEKKGLDQPVKSMQQKQQFPDRLIFRKCVSRNTMIQS